MRVLLICDDHYHPGRVPIEGIEPLKDKGFAFDIVTIGKGFNPAVLSDYATVLLCKGEKVALAENAGWKADALQQAFIAYVEQGGGLLVVHNGTVPDKDTEELEQLMGCRFVFHPNNCPVMVQPLKPHPITEGVEVFCEVDEHYHIEILADDIDILLASYAPSQGEESKYESEPYFNIPARICPAGYVRTQGKGRICVLTPGHDLPVWLNPNFQRMLENALNWTAHTNSRLTR